MKKCIQQIGILREFVSEFEIVMLAINSVVGTAKNLADEIKHRV